MSVAELIQPITKRPAWRRCLPWVGLLCVCISFVVAVVRLHPANFFGFTEDDSIYFSSAKALAQGKGYVLESFPGTPAATKYPEFYPWILSWVWRVNASFPANLKDAIAITVVFGLVYIPMVFLFLRGINGFSDAEALLLTLFCALHPVVLFYSGQVLSDIPFAALALAAIVLAEWTMRRGGGNASTALCGVVAGLSMLTRVVGVPVAGGIALALVLRKAWRQLGVFCACAGPFFAVLAWRAIFPRLPVSPVSGAASSSLGWVHTWTFYTSYLNVWKQGVPSAALFALMLRNNALWLLRTPADYFAWPWPVARTVGGEAFAVALTTLILKGCLSVTRRAEGYVVRCILPLYACVLLLWNYPDESRFFILFLPLFAAGAWCEGKHLAKMVCAAMDRRGWSLEKAIAVSLGIVLAVFVSAVSLNYAAGLREIIAKMSKDRGSLLVEKREAYNWLTRDTAPNSRVIAYEDASLYLYSGRVAVRAIAFTTAEFYRPWRLTRSLRHLTDVAQAIDADYWVVSEDDYGDESASATPKARARTKQLEKVLPLVYRSRYGRVRIYSLGCVQHPQDSSCELARAVLFPGGWKAAPSELISSSR